MTSAADPGGTLLATVVVAAPAGHVSRRAGDRPCRRRRRQPQCRRLAPAEIAASTTRIAGRRPARRRRWRGRALWGGGGGGGRGLRRPRRATPAIVRRFHGHEGVLQRRLLPLPCRPEEARQKTARLGIRAQDTLHRCCRRCLSRACRLTRYENKVPSVADDTSSFVSYTEYAR